MAAADMAAWRRQNSANIPVDLVMVDGTTLKGTLLVSRDKSMRDFFNVETEAFVDFDCRRDGMLVIAKASIRLIRSACANTNDDRAKIDALAARLAELEKSNPYTFLGVEANVDRETLHKAYIAMARMYHPDRFADAALPPEVMDYLNAMARRINSVYDELVETRG